jgi:hypothetical protein
LSNVPVAEGEAVVVETEDVEEVVLAEAGLEARRGMVSEADEGDLQEVTLAVDLVVVSVDEVEVLIRYQCSFTSWCFED